MSRHKMPFGKWKGYWLDEIEVDYLLWALSNLDINPPLLERIVTVLEEEHFIVVTPDMLFGGSGKGGTKEGRPKGAQGSSKNGNGNGNPPKFENLYIYTEENKKIMVGELIATGFKQLSKKYHPDLGGKKEEMQLLNEINTWLKKELGIK